MWSLPILAAACGGAALDPTPAAPEPSAVTPAPRPSVDATAKDANPTPPPADAVPVGPLSARPASSPDPSRSRRERAREGCYGRGMYYAFHCQMKKMLGQLDTWLDAAEAHAKAKLFDPAVYLSLRLSPDQFGFAKQVQTACDTAKLAASRLTGKDAPSHADTEATVAELQTRVRSTIAYLDGISEADYAAAATRIITTPRWEGKVMTGADYFMEHAVPNFFFHLTHAYALLRHAGVSVGKRDFLGAQTRRAP